MIVADESADRGQVEEETAHLTDVPARRFVLRVDHSERHARLLDLVRTCIDFDVRMDRADEVTLTEVRGVGRKKAARIRELVR